MATTAKTKLKLVESSAKAKLTIPVDITRKIDYLCRTIPNVEWSGVLFYTVTGDIDDPSKMEFIVRDIHPLDKGTSAATDYEFEPEALVDLFDAKPELMGYKMGHIHSHNTMAVFFSGTDNDELAENADNHNGYLSLIVNNAGDTKAKFVVVATNKVKTEFTFKSLSGKIFKGKKPIEEEEKVAVTIDIDIEKEEIEGLNDKVFLDQVKEITKPTPVRSTPGVPAFSSNTPPFQNYMGQGKYTGVRNGAAAVDENEEIITFIIRSLTGSTYYHHPLTAGGIASAVSEVEREYTRSPLVIAEFVDNLIKYEMVDAANELCDGFYNQYSPTDKAKLTRAFEKASQTLSLYKTSDVATELAKRLNGFLLRGLENFVKKG